MNNKKEHSVLIKFQGSRELAIYQKICGDAEINNLPIRTYIVMLLNKHYNKTYLVKGDAENLKE